MKVCIARVLGLAVRGDVEGDDDLLSFFDVDLVARRARSELLDTEGRHFPVSIVEDSELTEIGTIKETHRDLELAIIGLVTAGA